MDDEVRRAPGGRSPDTSSDSEMAEGGSVGRRPVVGDETGYTAGGSSFTAARQRIGRSRCVAPEGRAGLLPIPRCSREHDSVTHLQTSCVQAMAECSGPPQPARTDALATFYPSLEPLDSSPRVLPPYPDARFYATHPS